MYRRSIFTLTQLYGGKHTGIDARTKGEYKYIKYYDQVKQEPRPELEKNGRIPLIASFDGTLDPVLHDNKQEKGWGIWLTSEPFNENNETLQIKALYWHIESPWSSLKAFVGMVYKTLRRRTVRQGSIIAIAGDNGISTGPHLHFEYHYRKRLSTGNWSYWQRLDPITMFHDSDVIAQAGSRWFYNGVEKTRAEADEILKNMPIMAN